MFLATYKHYSVVAGAAIHPARHKKNADNAAMKFLFILRFNFKIVNFS
jgi:hypothetical protein